MTSVTYCSSALCQHPTCWEAQRLLERGLVKPQEPATRKEPQYEALPTQQIVNLFDVICGDSSSDSSLLLSASFRHNAKDNCAFRNSTDRHYSAGSSQQAESIRTSSNSCLVAAPTPASLRALPDESNDAVSRTANKIPITSTNSVSSAAVHQVQIHEIFDPKDLRSRWRDNFTMQTYYVWVPGPHSTNRRLSRAAELQVSRNNGRPIVNDISSQVKLDPVPRVSAVTRNRTILKSPRSFQLRLKAATSSVQPKADEPTSKPTTSVITIPSRASNRSSLPADWKSMKKLVLRGRANYKSSAGDGSSDVCDCAEQTVKIPPAASDVGSSSRTQPLSLNTDRTGLKQPLSQMEDTPRVSQPVAAPPAVSISEPAGNWRTGIAPPGNVPPGIVPSTGGDIPATGTAPANMAPTGLAPAGMVQAGLAQAGLAPSPSSPSTHIPSAPHATPATPMVLMLPTDRLINRSIIINTDLLESPDDSRTEIPNISTREVASYPAERHPFLPPLPKSAQQIRRRGKTKHRISSSPAVVERLAVNMTGSPRPQSLPLSDDSEHGHQQSGSPLGRRSSPVRVSRPATGHVEQAVSPPRPASIRIIRPEPTPPPPSPDVGKDGTDGLLEPEQDYQRATIDRGLTGVSVDQLSTEVENIYDSALVVESQNDVIAEENGTLDEAACKCDKSDQMLETNIDANNNCDKGSSDDVRKEKNETHDSPAAIDNGEDRESLMAVGETDLGKTQHNSNDVECECECESTSCIVKLDVSNVVEDTEDKDDLSDADGKLEEDIAASVVSETDLEIPSLDPENPSVELEIPSFEPENPSTELENSSVSLENPHAELEIPSDFREDSTMAYSTQENSRADYLDSGENPSENTGECFDSFAAGLRPLLTPECILVPAKISDMGSDFMDPTKEDFEQELMDEYAKLSN